MIAIDEPDNSERIDSDDFVPYQIKWMQESSKHCLIVKWAYRKRKKVVDYGN